MIPIPSDSIEKMYKETGPKEGFAAHKVLETENGIRLSDSTWWRTYVFLHNLQT